MDSIVVKSSQSIRYIRIKELYVSLEGRKMNYSSQYRKSVFLVSLHCVAYIFTMITMTLNSLPINLLMGLHTI